MRNHKSAEIVIKKAVVDVEIQPVINWLNSYKSVITTNSCQGDNEEETEKRKQRALAKQKESGFQIGWSSAGGYITFHCGSAVDLASILNALNGKILEVDYCSHSYSPILYAVRWKDFHDLERTINYLKLHGYINDEND